MLNQSHKEAIELNKFYFCFEIEDDQEAYWIENFKNTGYLPDLQVNRCCKWQKSHEPLEVKVRIDEMLGFLRIVLESTKRNKQ